MKVTSEQLQELIQEAQNYVLLSEIDVNKFTEEIFLESNRSLDGITYEELREICSEIFTATMQKWDRETDFEQFVKKRYPGAEELQKLLILVGPQDE